MAIHHPLTSLKWVYSRKFRIENSAYTSEELAGKIGLTKRTIERTFISLKNKKVIQRIGSKRDGRWIVIK